MDVLPQAMTAWGRASALSATRLGSFMTLAMLARELAMSSNSDEIAVPSSF